MKLHTQILTASVLAISATSVFAAGSADLKVSGKVVTGACDISLPGGDLSDFGVIREEDIDSTGELDSSKSKHFSIVVQCSGIVPIAIAAIDNNPAIPNAGRRNFNFFRSDGSYIDGASLNYSYFGGGLASNGVAVAVYAMRVGNATVDEITARTLLRGRPGFVWQKVPNYGGILTDPGIYITPGTSDNIPVAGSNYSFPVDIAVNFTPRNQLPADQNLNIDASATFEVKYL